MTNNLGCSKEELIILGNAAGLSFTEERAELLAPKAAAWLNAANELNTFMSQKKFMFATPITLFTHTKQGVE